MDGLRVESFSPVGTPRPTVWSFDSLGFGFSARTLLYRFEDKEWLESRPFLRDLYRDQWVYAGAAVRALAASYVEDHAFDARITTPEGTTFYEGLHDLIVNNTRYYAQAWVIDPAGRHDDGLAELVVIRDMDDWAGRALVTLDGNPLREWAEADVGDEVAHVAWCEIELFDRPMEPPIPAQVDGEPVEPCGRVRVDVIQGVLELCVPTTPAG
jgi:diacylglycerol kinase family enzyme